jgi:hypothetical protein
VNELGLDPAALDTTPAETPREYFRRFLSQHAPGTADLAWYFDQALPRFSEGADVHLAVEELIDQIGRIAGFDVVREETDGYGLWSSAGGSHLLVWVLEAATALRQIGHAGRARDAWLAGTAAPAGARATCLLVLCGAVNQRLLDDTVALRRASDHVRLITVDSLRVLASHVESGVVTGEGARLLLSPPGAFADPMIALTTEAVGLRLAEGLKEP